MQVGTMGPSHARCTCGWESEPDQRGASMKLRKAMNLHANTCDLALEALLAGEKIAHVREPSCCGICGESPPHDDCPERHYPREQWPLLESWRRKQRQE